MPGNVYGQYRRVLNANKNALKRVRPVPAGSQREQKRSEMCTASTEEAVGPGPNGKLVQVKQLTVN